jgi:hypothetical protein
MRFILAWRAFRDSLVPVTPIGLVSGAIGLAVVLIPGAQPISAVRLLAACGIVLAVASVVVAEPGLVTMICGLGIIEATIVAVKDDGLALPLLEAACLLGYLVVVDVARRRGAVRCAAGRLAREQAGVLAGGVVVAAFVAALALVPAGGSFGLAVLAAAASVGAVLVARWLTSH